MIAHCSVKYSLARRARADEAAAAILEVCSTDMELRPDERMMLSYFSMLPIAAHPDALDCRLKLFAAMCYCPNNGMGTSRRGGEKPGWYIDAAKDDFNNYLVKLTHVSQACKLHRSEVARLVFLGVAQSVNSVPFDESNQSRSFQGQQDGGRA